MSYNFSFLEKLSTSKYIPIFIILIVSTGVYLNTLSNDFVFDDNVQVLKNPWIKDVKYIPEIFLKNVWAFDGRVSNYYRPLMHIFYMVDYHFFGLKPWGFHLTNILFHSGVSILVFIIASSFNKFPIPNPETKNFSIDNRQSALLNSPFIASLLFAAHPIHTEAVAWIAAIPELSFTFFYLLSFYLYTKADNLIGKWSILSILFFLIATLCKETALTLPILLIAYDYSFRKYFLKPFLFDFSSLTVYFKKYLPYLIVVIVYFILRSYAMGGRFTLSRKHNDLSNYECLINIFPLFIQYIEKLFIPINLNAIYVFHPISSILTLKGMATLILTLVFISFVYLSKPSHSKGKGEKVVFFTLLWITIPLLPVLYIPVLGGNAFTERYLYLPSTGFVILISAGIEKINQLKIFGKATFPLIISTLLITLGLYSAGTIKRNYIWRDDYSLWLETVQKSPDSPTAHTNLGLVYDTTGLFNKAIEHYLKALVLNSELSAVHFKLAIIYKKIGLIDKSIEHYITALSLKPEKPEDIHNNLANVYIIKGLNDKAIEHFIKALKLKPDDADVHNNLGNVYHMKGLNDKAIEHFTKALKLKPDDPDIHFHLAMVYDYLGDSQNAIKEYRITLSLDPANKQAKERLELVIKENR